MSTYSFIIKKGSYRLELCTTDKELLTEQFEKWVRQAGEYARQKKANECRNLVNTQIQTEEEITKKNIETQIAKRRTSEPKKVEEPLKKEYETEKKQDINSEQKISQESLDIFYAPANKETISQYEQEQNTPKEAQSNGVFDNLLEKSMKSPQTELTFKQPPSIKKDNAFLNYINSRNIEKKVDYLLLTAYYFAQFEQKPRFTLKQLNSKLMQNLAVIIDHSVLQEAVNRDYIECLPDLTGLIGASEYRLTSYGEKTILDA